MVKNQQLMKFLHFFTFLLFASFILMISCSNAFAGTDPNQKSTIKANELKTNTKENTISAYGNVQLISGERIFYADELKYYRVDGKIKAKGQVKLKDEKSNSILAEEAELKDDASKGEFYDALILFPNGSFLYSPKVVKESPSISRLFKPDYGVCPSDVNFNQSYEEIVEQTLGKKQFLSVSASSVEVNNEKEGVFFKNALPKIYGVPLFYFPYLKTGQPFQKKTTGFEAPRLQKNSNYGYGLFLPYYIKISESQEARITPVFYEEENMMLQLEYGKNSEKRNGFFTFNGDVTYDNGASDAIIDTNYKTRIENGYEEEARGYGEVDGALEISRKWDLHFYGVTISDKHYLKDYKNNYTDYLQSYGTIERLDKNNIFSFTVLNFRELQDRSDLNVSDSPNAIPIFDHKIKKNFLTLNTNITSIYRNDGLQYRRFTLDPSFEVPYKFYGSLFKLRTALRGDFYSLEENYKKTRATNYNKEEARFVPQAKLNWEHPIVTYNKDSTFIVAPKANFIISKEHNADNADIVNEDSVASELNDVNLFLDNRYGGYDRIEYGPRISYGLETTLFYNYVGDFDAFMGQSYRTDDENNIGIRGFRENVSGWVGRVSYTTNRLFDVYYRFLLDRTNFKEKTNETQVDLNISKLIIGVNYTMFDPEVLGDPKRKEISTSGTLNITKKWKFIASITRDLLENQNTNKSAELKYSGGCVEYSLSVDEYRPVDQKKTDRNIDFRFNVKSNLF
ncbi:LPS-assembly protein LptD [Pseudomonadota bacterium]